MLAVESLVLGGGYVVALHEALGEVLRALEHGTGLRRTDDGDIRRPRVGLQVVVDALHQRVFRSDDHHLYAVVGDELLDGLEVVGLHGHVLATLRRAGVAGGNIEFLTLGALCNLPCQGVLTAAAA